MNERDRNETTRELTDKALARLRRENMLVAMEVWVDMDHRVDLVAFRPHGRGWVDATNDMMLERGTFTFCEVKSCMDDYRSGHGLCFGGDENWLVCPEEMRGKLIGPDATHAAVYTPDASGRLRKRVDERIWHGVPSMRMKPALELLYRMCCCSTSLWRQAGSHLGDRPLLSEEAEAK